MKCKMPRRFNFCAKTLPGFPCCEKAKKKTNQGEGWPQQSDFARLLQLTPSEAYLGVLTPVTFLVLIKMAVSH